MRAIIVDDEENSRELLQNMLGLYCPTIEVVDLADSVQKGYASILNHNPDVVFLDVQMGDGTGFDLLSLFDSVSFHIIFTTAFQEYAIEAFQYSAVDYLLKPISPAYLVKAVNKTEQLYRLKNSNVEIQTLLSNLKVTEKENKRLVVKTHDRIYSILPLEIIRCESDSSYTTIFLQDGHKVVVARQLKEFDEILSPAGFMRVHQSHLINLQHLFYYQKGNNQIIMKDKSTIPVSSKKKEDLMDYIRSK